MRKRAPCQAKERVELGVGSAWGRWDFFSLAMPDDRCRAKEDEDLREGSRTEKT